MVISLQERNQIFDEIVKSRRSVREFKEEKPPKEQIEGIIEAGMLAPYAAAAVRDEKDFRRFFVFEKGGSAFEAVSAIIKKNAASGIQHYKKLMEEKPSIKSQVEPFLERMQKIADKGLPGLHTAPYFIVVGELRGTPPAEQRSLAHVLENMWLKATALNLGFQLISATSQLADNGEFIELLGVPPKKFGFGSCAIGYPAVTPPPTYRPDVHKATRWMD